ncbi:MAG: ACT domain-containing protein [Gemmatimonadota bacterium]|nr:ACT domain-containing protein [Gemmatimonadota bacterium]
MHKLTLELLEPFFAVAKLDPDAAIPDWAHASVPNSISRTDQELSIICPQNSVPESVSAQLGFRCMRVKGPLEFSAVGVLASLVGPLAEAGVNILAFSTYDTDYLLVPGGLLEKSVRALKEVGHIIEE